MYSLLSSIYVIQWKTYIAYDFQKEGTGMKLTELKCTACNGTLKLDEKNPHVTVCEYCRSHYVLEDEGEGNIRLSSQPIEMNYVP